MAGNIKKYVLGRERLKHALTDGFSLREDGVLEAGEQPVRHIFLKSLDGTDPEVNWGRLSLRARFVGDLVLTVHALASDEPVFLRKGVLTKIDDFLLSPEISADTKEQFFGAAGGLEVAGATDVLLYGLRGRYLSLWLELSGVGSAALSDLRVYVPGDNFLSTFPEVYRTPGDFLQRYLSVLSTPYQALQEKIDHLDSVLDVETASVPALHHFASWLGVHTEDSHLGEADLRRLLRALPELLHAKGTKCAIEKLVGLFTTRPFYVVEHHLLTDQQMDSLGSTPFDFTILINSKADSELRHTMAYFIDQLKPVRSRCKIVFFGENSQLDAVTFLDLDARVLESSTGKLDEGRALTGMTYLQ